MRKLIPLSFLFWLLPIFLLAQAPAGYYDAASGKTGASLKTALFNIIKTHTQRTYTQLWSDFQTTDKRADGYVWDIYSSCNLVFVTDQDNGSGGSTECDKYNREHSFPNSWFGGVQSSPMYTDLFHMYPTDKKVNNVRSNYIYGIVQTPSYTSSNGSKLGSSDLTTGFSGTVFEPIDEYKGDLARTYLYMATCYEDKIASWTSYDTEAKAILDGDSFPAYKAWYVQLLLKWSSDDPVSQKEIDRNNAIYGIQGNRNPFIDHPEYAAMIWDATNSVTTVTNSSISIYPNPANSDFKVDMPNQSAFSVEVFDLTGKSIKKIDAVNPNQAIQVGNLRNGLYLVKIKYNGGSVVKKITIQK